jgi:hypothetical protein
MLLLPSTVMALSIRAPAMQRVGNVRMDEGLGYKSGGFAASTGAKYSGAGLSTSAKPGESLRPEGVDLEAAAKSQEGIEGPPVDVAIAGGFGKKTSIIDNLRVGDGKLAGDVGFDPLQLADSSAALAWYREAEMKHARLAMLAAVGWPIAEKLNGPLSAALGQESLLVDGRSPTVLNGGLGAVSVVYWLAALGLAIFVENAYLDNQIGRKKDTDYVPGMLGFDPLGGDSPATRNAEIWSGRVAMLAVSVYALEESLTKAPLLP